ncbi:cobyrinic acid a,c-diamide synthase [Methylobacterium sp. Leaf113]|nr:cobyrinic acid a,c-diamide synthase [Methylobacterium sp. Leaf113]
MIVSFLCQKGGVGKSTLSINVAAALARSSRVLLIDADEQGSAASWASLREETPFRVIGMARDNMARDAIQMASDYTHTVIDGPPRAQKIARGVIIASDMVLVPIEPSGLSMWAASETVAQIQEAQSIKPNLKCGFVVSRKIGHTVIGREIRDLAAREGFPILQAEIHQRVPFAESLTLGQTIFEYAPDSAASREIEALLTEIKAWMTPNGKTKIQRSAKASRADG